MRCPHCGATNGETAEWCTQCFELLREPEPEPDPEPPQREGSASATPTTAGTGDAERDMADQHASSTAQDQAVATRDGKFRRSGDLIEWRCVRCESWNEVGLTTCTTCSAPFADTVAPDRDNGPEEPEASPAAALLASALVAGAGHILLGRSASGSARAVLYVLFVAGSAVLGAEARASGQSIVSVLPMVAGALAIWAGSLYDVYVLTSGGERQLLEARALLWLFLGAFGLTLLLLGTTVASVGG